MFEQLAVQSKIYINSSEEIEFSRIIILILTLPLSFISYSRFLLAASIKRNVYFLGFYAKEKI